MEPRVKIAILDNSLNPDLYDPVSHWRRYLSVPWQAFRPSQGDLPLLEQGFSHLLLTGSEGSMLEPENWVEGEVKLVAEAVGRGLAILGSCFGHHLLATALAGPGHVRRCPQPEVGWLPIRLLRPSRLLGEAGQPYMFSVHSDEVIGLEESFEVLAASEACPIQAFCLKGRPIWGLQPHPEIVRPAARRLLRKFSGLNPALRPFYEKGLASPFRDSGLITRIVRTFVRALPEN